MVVKLPSSAQESISWLESFLLVPRKVYRGWKAFICLGKYIVVGELSSSA